MRLNELFDHPPLRAAIRTNGKVYAGDGTHLDVLRSMPSDVARNAMSDGNNRGFLTDTGRFLNRRQAAQYARNQSLWKKGTPDWVIDAPEMASETFLQYGLNESMEGPMIKVYHAQFHQWPGVLKNRMVKNYNSMGTWFTSNPNVAAENYGNKIGIYEIPAEGFLEMDNDNIRTSIGHCYPLINKHFGKTTEIDLANSENPKEITVNALKHQGYCQDFRDMIRNANYHGLVWRNVHWDKSTEPSDIYLVFHEEDIHPIKVFQS